jgi:DNA processing protein
MCAARTRPLSNKERVSWLRLTRTEGVGPVTFRELLARFGSAERALDALPEIARRARRARPLRIPSAAAAERELAQIERFGARYLGLVEPDYPAALSAIDDAPPLVMLAGNEHLLKRSCVTLVGARNASLNGRKLAESLARELAQEGFLMVSRMARGIDTAAHTGTASGSAARADWDTTGSAARTGGTSAHVRHGGPR